MRRIGHLVAAPRVLGGVGTAVEGLIEAGKRRGIEQVTVLAVRSQDSDTRWIGSAAAALNVQRLDRPELDFSVRDLDGLVVHGVFHPGVARAVRYVQDRYPTLPVVSFPHDAYDDGLFERRRAAKVAYFSVIERQRLRASRAVLTTAPSHEAWLRRRGISTPVHCAPLGLSEADRAAATAVLRMRRAAQDRPARLLFVGRWDIHEKGLDLALNAVAGLERGQAALRVVGPTLGHEHHVARLAAAAGSDIELVGYVPDVWAELAVADLLLMPSRKEGFGIAGLQALAAGVPVLLSRRAGLADYVGSAEGAHITAPTPHAVAAALRAALESLPELTRAASSAATATGAAGGWSYDRLCDSMLAALAEPLRVP